MPLDFHLGPQSLIDLSRYPIDEPDSVARRELVAQCRQDLAEKALCTLPGFIQPNAVREMEAELAPSYGHACVREDTHNFAYDDSWPEETRDDLADDDPRRIRLVSKYAQLRNYQISTDSQLRKLYMWEPLTAFVRDVFDAGPLYRSQCPHLALSLKIEGEGDVDNWHYDSNDGVVSILLKNADEGGDFEYVPYLRSEDDERYDRVAEVLADPEEHAIRKHAAPGDFTLFNGRLSLHRVSPVGPTTTPRVIALLCWDREPDQVHRQSYIDYLNSLPTLGSSAY